MTPRFDVQARSALLQTPQDRGVTFHGINKSGSLAMANVLREALVAAGREDEVLSHYHMKPAPSLEDYRAMIEARTGRYFAVAHYLYGFLGPSPRRIWITQFRHPLPRIVSVHQWLKTKHAKANGGAEGYPDLSRFVRQGRGVAHSQVAQFGAGFGRFERSEAKLSLPPATLFELSVEAIERDVSLIGIAEHFEESIFAFAALLGLPSVAPWAKDTRNPGRPLVDELTPAERDLIHEVYEWDFALYDWALRRFAAQNARIDFGPELDRYKAACQGSYKDRLLVDLTASAATLPAAASPQPGDMPASAAEESSPSPARSPQEEIARLRTEIALLQSSSRIEVGLRGDVAARDARITRLTNELAARDAQAAAQEAEIARLGDTAEARGAQALARATEVARLTAEVARLKAEVARLGSEIDRIRTSRDTQVARLTQRLEQARASHEAAVAQLRAETAAYARSWSWRLTTPLRLLSSQARRLRRRS